MTMFTNDGERILSLERFRPMLKSLQCGSQMILAFNSKETFEYAIRAWDWVNENETHAFIMIADDPGCGPDDDRVPYYIYDADYDEENFVAYLYGAEKNWKEVAHSFDLEYGAASVPDPKEKNLDKRLFSKDWHRKWSPSIETNFNHNIFDVQHRYGGMKLDCIDCGTSGHFTMQVRVVVRLFVPQDIWVNAAPEEMRADLGLRLTTRIERTPIPISLSYSKPVLPKIPIGPALPIRGIGSIGVFLKVKVGISTQDPHRDAVTDFGAYAKLSDKSIAQISLAGKKKNEFWGWTPEFGVKPFKVYGNVSSTFNVFAQLTVGPSLEIFGVGVEAVIAARFPEFRNKINTYNKKGSGSSCAEKGMDGASIDVYCGASIAARVGTSGDLAVTGDVTPVFKDSNKKRGMDGKMHDNDTVQVPATRKKKMERRAMLQGAVRGQDSGQKTDIAERGIGDVFKDWLPSLRASYTLYVSFLRVTLISSSSPFPDVLPYAET